MSKKKKEEREGQDETTKGKEAPADIEKKLQRCRLIFRKEGTKSFYRRWLYSVMWINRKIDERRSRLSQIVQILLLHRVRKMKTEGSKLLKH